MNTSRHAAPASRAHEPALRHAIAWRGLLARRVARGGAGRSAARIAVLPSVDSRIASAPSGEGRRGPGWFDSSWDLRQGLEVHEGLPADARLSEWIEVCLRG